MTNIDWNQYRLTSMDIKAGSSNNVVLTIQDKNNRVSSKAVYSMPVDRNLASTILESQNKYTTPANRRAYGGAGITMDEMKAIFTSARDTGANGRGGATTITPGESVLLQALDTARDDRYTVRVNGTKLNLTGGAGTNSGAEGEFNRQYQSLRSDIWSRNLLGIPVPENAR